MPTIALVGRTNVGKSTLFNRLLEKQKALVSDVSGTTRTRNIGVMHWRGTPIRVIDTGGLTYEKEYLFEQEVIDQSELALTDADVVLFVVDIQTGILPQEEELANRLRKLNKPVVVVANKADTRKWRTPAMTQSSMALGFGEPFTISATGGGGIGDMLDHVYEQLPNTDHQHDSENLIAKVALIGKPNVGKSSLLNAFAGSDEVIVSEMPHTTRESFDIDVQYEDKKFRIIDTAGIRKKAKVKPGLEKFGVQDSIRAIDEADVALLVLDVTKPFSNQEKHLISMIKNKDAGIIFVMNKWDEVEDHSQEKRTELIKLTRVFYPFLKWAPVMFVSAKTGFRVHKLFDMIEEVAAKHERIIPQEELETWVQAATRKHKPTIGKGSRKPKILAFEQVGTKPPRFMVTIKYKTSLHESYLHFLENQLRASYDFEGVPIFISVKKFRG